jgi:hypothetical protein
MSASSPVASRTRNPSRSTKRKRRTASLYSTLGFQFANWLRRMPPVRREEFVESKLP